MTHEEIYTAAMKQIEMLQKLCTKKTYERNYHSYYIGYPKAFCHRIKIENEILYVYTIVDDIFTQDTKDFKPERPYGYDYGIIKDDEYGLLARCNGIFTIITDTEINENRLDYALRQGNIDGVFTDENRVYLKYNNNLRGECRIEYILGNSKMENSDYFYTNIGVWNDYPYPRLEVMLTKQPKSKKRHTIEIEGICLRDDFKYKKVDIRGTSTIAEIVNVTIEGSDYPEEMKDILKERFAVFQRVIKKIEIIRDNNTGLKRLGKLERKVAELNRQNRLLKQALKSLGQNPEEILKNSAKNEPGEPPK